MRRLPSRACADTGRRIALRRLPAARRAVPTAWRGFPARLSRSPDISSYAKTASDCAFGAGGSTFLQSGCDVQFKDSVRSSVRDTPMGESVSQQTDAARVHRFSPKWWAKVAMQVALDPAVSDKACRVYTLISAHAKGNTADVGQRRLASLMRKNQAYISRRVNELRKSGWLGTKNVGKGRRTVYVLLSAAYEGEPSSDAVASPPSAEVQCARCHCARKAIPASGICRKCVREMNEERMLMVAREKLGPQATLEELALECHIQRITPRIRKILRRLERAA